MDRQVPRRGIDDHLRRADQPADEPSASEPLDKAAAARQGVPDLTPIGQAESAGGDGDQSDPTTPAAPAPADLDGPVLQGVTGAPAGPLPAQENLITEGIVTASSAGQGSGYGSGDENEAFASEAPAENAVGADAGDDLTLDGLDLDARPAWAREVQPVEQREVSEVGERDITTPEQLTGLGPIAPMPLFAMPSQPAADPAPVEPPTLPTSQLPPELSSPPAWADPPGLEQESSDYASPLNPDDDDPIDD
jgi:hypothetical protein